MFTIFVAHMGPIGPGGPCRSPLPRPHDDPISGSFISIKLTGFFLAAVRMT